MRSTARQRAEAGLTIIELMTVVAIIGVLSTLAAIALKRDRDTSQVADLIAIRITECVRLASMSGTVRSDVAATGITARARLVITPAATGDQQLLTLDRLVEDDLPADTAAWLEVSVAATGEGIRVAGYRDEAVLTQGVGPSDLLGDADELEILCFPDGSTEARTLFLEGDGGSERARVTVLPLTGETVALRGW